MRRIRTLVLLAAAPLAVSATAAHAAPSNSPNNAVVDLSCVDDSDEAEAFDVQVFAPWNSSGVVLFEDDATGRAYVMSWYKITYTDPEPDVVFEKSYGARKGYDNSFTCHAGPFDDDDGYGEFFVEVGLKSK